MKPLNIYIYALCIFFTVFLKLNAIGFSDTISMLVYKLMLVYLLFSCRDCFNYIFTSGCKYVTYSLLLYCIVACVSSYINYDQVHSMSFELVWDGEVYEIRNMPINAVFYFITELFVSYLVVVKHIRYGVLSLFLKTLFFLFIFVFIYNNINAYLTKLYRVEAATQYWIGNKFSVCYYNLFFIVLYYLNNPKLESKKKFVFFLILLISFLIGIKVKCSTFVIAFPFLFYLVFVKKKIVQSFYKPTFFIAFLFFCDVCFFIFCVLILQNSFIVDFIDFLDEDITLSGRTTIYADIQQVISEKIWLGYGYGNTTLISFLYTGAQNSQNGLVEKFLEVGLVGTIAYFGVVFFSIKRVPKGDLFAYPILIFIYILLFVSMVEIPFKNSFLFFVFLLNNMLVYQYQERNVSLE